MSLKKHIHKEFTENRTDYLFLISAGIFYILTSYLFRGERALQFLCLVIFGFVYILWGIVHHHKNHSLHLKAVIEYILISFTVLFLLKLILYP
jgi:uncharacterized membrane protein